MKTVVFAYSEFGCVGIEALVKAGYEISAVFTYRDDPKENVFYRSVAQICVNHNLPAYVWEDESDAVRMQQLADIAPEYIFSFYYRSLLPDAVLTAASKGAFNIHGSLLPHYRGRAPVNWVLVRGETVTGVTLHHMVARADAGDIVDQVKVNISYDDTAFTLQRKLVNAARELFAVQLPLIAQGKAKRTVQDISQGNYCGRRGPKDGLIDWTQSAETARNLIRAVTLPYPGAFSYIGNHQLFIWESAVDRQAQGEPGSIVSLSPLTVACGKGALIIKAAQVGSDGLYLSGAQLAQELQLKTGMRFTSQKNAA